VIADSVDPTFELDTFKGELREAAQQLQAAGVAAQAVEKAGNPAATIIETAESGGYDLVVVGVRGRHAIARFLFGSTADRVARHATTPVLVVR
jgi:nucleotide-binding universal stress UspA family protein